MAAPSLSHLLQSNGATDPGPGLPANSPDHSQNVAGTTLSYTQLPTSRSSLPSATPTVISPVRAPDSGSHFHHRHGEASLNLGPTPAPVLTPANQSHLMTSSLYQCADCKRRYSRPEHLARHIQTHTLGKRFFCQVCGKAFARADLLKRHTANHENDGDGTKKRRRVDASPGSGRVSHACRSCAAARVKCEENKPCQRCQKKGLTCEYAASESGPGAAHLHRSSIDIHHNSNASGASSHSSQLSPATSQDQRAVALGTATQPMNHEDRDNMSNADVKPDLGQLPTPDGIIEQSMSFCFVFNLSFYKGHHCLHHVASLDIFGDNLLLLNFLLST